jgi:membrane-bound serine protease (ClpP class)
VAGEKKMACLVVELDTPGGLVESTKQIVQAFYASTVPIVVYVAPAGSTATSAGCFITLAADVAAMAPGTSIGAAHPVSMGGTSGSEENTDSVMKEKLANYAGAFIESIAARRHRNVDWAKSSVHESAAITAEKALELKVIDLMAPTLPDLLKQLEGRNVNGSVLHTANAQVNEIPMLAQESFFSQLWRPEVMFILMLIAIYGIIGELSNPGAVLPGVLGAIALILALYMASVLPVSLAGAALMLLAVVLFVIDVYAPTHGILTFGGVIAFFLGSLMLFNTGEPGFRLSLKWIIPATAITALFFLFVVGAGLRAQRNPVRVGKETLVGRTVTALMPIDSDSGKVFLEGEYWNAVSDSPVPKGGSVVITGFKGLTLLTKPHNHS